VQRLGGTAEKNDGAIVMVVRVDLADGLVDGADVTDSDPARWLVRPQAPSGRGTEPRPRRPSRRLGGPPLAPVRPVRHGCRRDLPRRAGRCCACSACRRPG
jgi:hypothetical protein